MQNKLKKILKAAIITAIGLILLKYIPMKIFGPNILFDASSHVSITMFCLYLIWITIEYRKTWKVPYLILSFSVIIIISIQRIFIKAHNEVGILLGIAIGILSILFAENYYKVLLKKN